MAGRILIADNVATNRIILKVKLAGARYEIAQAATVAELLAQAERELPDLILADTDLPAGGMTAICAGLHADPRLAGIPVIGISAQAARRARLAALHAGADEVLVKPLNEITLLALIRSLSRSSAAHLELRRKQTIAREFGLAENAPGFARRARIAIVPKTPEHGIAQRASLTGKCRAEVSIMNRAQALDGNLEGGVPDAFVISVDPDAGCGGIQLVAELRAQAQTRQAVIIAHDTGPDGAMAAMALDMGANSVLCGRFDADELALRLTRLIRRKLEADSLRAGLDQQLSFAMTDPLTGLFNRRYAQSYLKRIRKHARLKRQPFTLMMLDLDRFKRINDRHGHAVGDEVLIEVARRLRDNLREMDLVARHGGEEFLVVLPDTGHDEAARTAERLRRTLGDRPVICAGQGGLQVPVTASIGVVVADANTPVHDSIDRLISRADQALFASKADGRNQVTFVQAAA